MAPSSLSVFALHPMYINLEALKPSKKILDEIARVRVELEGHFLDYEKVLSTKMRLLREIFEEQRKVFVAGEDFQQFFTDNRDWIQVTILRVCHIANQSRPTLSFAIFTQNLEPVTTTPGPSIHTLLMLALSI